MMRQIRPFSVKSDKYFLLFLAAEDQPWKSAKIGPFQFGQNGWIFSTRGRNAISQLIGVVFLLIFPLTQPSRNEASNKTIFSQIW